MNALSSSARLTELGSSELTLSVMLAAGMT